MSSYQIEYVDLETLGERIAGYPGDAEAAINEVLHKKAFLPLTESIKELIHPSGRNWKGKKKAAKETQPFVQRNENLAVQVKSRSAYNYLYFPDDGSNTVHHYGGQNFMIQGAEQKQSDIIDMITEQIIQQIEEE